ncbi:hypothetical protein D3C76_1383320 [compost metagenome]
MRRLQRRNDPFGPAQQLERIQRFAVGDRVVFRAFDILQIRVLRTDPWIIQACRNRMGRQHLTVSVLQQITHRTLEDAFRAFGHRGGMEFGIDAFAGRFHAHKTNILILDERIKHADRIAAAAYRCDEHIRQSAFGP